MHKYLLFDIGGTKTRVAASFDGTSFTDPIIYPTPQNYQQGVKELIKHAYHISKEGYDTVVGGVPGSLNKDKSKIINAPNLRDWQARELKAELQEALAAKVMLENDTALVGLGESVSGAAKDFEIVVYITISTGVNGVRVVNKQLDESKFGFEIGKQILDIETDSSWEEMLIHEDNSEEKEAALVAYGVYNSILFWSPEVVVLGGGRMQHIEINEVKRHLQGIRKIFPAIPKVTKSELGDLGGLYGALHYIKQK